MPSTRHFAFCLAAVLSVAADPCLAQFSSNLPGVPRASLPVRGGYQGRTAFDITGFRLIGAEGDTLAGQIQLGYGGSWRIRTNWEFGFDFSVAQGSFSRVDTKLSNPSGSLPDPVVQTQAESAYEGMALYGIRFGLKVRPITYVTPDGHGVEVAAGIAYQPSLVPGFAVAYADDTTRISGAFNAEDRVVEAIHASTQVGLFASYRSKRILADAALLSESATQAENSPLRAYSGFSPRVGGRFRLTPSFALGFSWWGSGAPPWRDQSSGRSPGHENSSFGVVAGFGTSMESGTDFIIVSPTGSFARSARLYVRRRTAY